MSGRVDSSEYVRTIHLSQKVEFANHPYGTNWHCMQGGGNAESVISSDEDAARMAGELAGHERNRDGLGGNRSEDCGLDLPTKETPWAAVGHAWNELHPGVTDALVEDLSGASI
jgi:hypothetical protein